jgi:hypothetical protein
MARVGLVAVLLVAAAPASAAHADDDGWGHGEDVVTPGGPGGGTGDDGDGPGSGDATEVAVTPIGYPHYSLALHDLDDGDRCWGIGVDWRDDPQTTGRTLEEIRDTIDDFDDNGALYDACPPATFFDVQGAAERYWLQVVPGGPAPSIDPGRAITGLRSYLVIDGPREAGGSLDTPIGAISISGAVRYDIAWGDGVSTSTDRSGVPYPGGPDEITHVYTDAGERTVTVTAVWSGTFSAPTASGSLPVIERTATVALPVGQVQSVRTH